MTDNWYAVTLLIQSIVGQDNEWTCDEQIRVLRASTSELAYEKALQLGKREEHSYANEYGQTVYWVFVGLIDLAELSDGSIEDGTEIKSRLFKCEDPAELVQPKERLTIFQWERERQGRTHQPKT